MSLCGLTHSRLYTRRPFVHCEAAANSVRGRWGAGRRAKAHPTPAGVSPTVFADGAALFGLVHGVHTLRLGTRRHGAQHLPVGLAAAPLARGHLEQKPTVRVPPPSLSCPSRLPSPGREAVRRAVGLRQKRFRPGGLWSADAGLQPGLGRARRRVDARGATGFLSPLPSERRAAS